MIDDNTARLYGFTYLASPYTHPDPAVMQARFEAAECAVAGLLTTKIPVYSPIVHCHSLAQRYDLPHDAAFWMWYNENMLAKADALAILILPGWDESKGVSDELIFAKKLQISTVHMSLGGFDGGDEHLAKLRKLA